MIDKDGAMPVNDDHIVVTYLHCKRTRAESVFSVNQETPFCPHCGQVLIDDIRNYSTKGPTRDD